jgi:hypothetical protein
MAVSVNHKKWANYAYTKADDGWVLKYLWIR